MQNSSHYVPQRHSWLCWFFMSGVATAGGFLAAFVFGFLAVLVESSITEPPTGGPGAVMASVGRVALIGFLAALPAFAVTISFLENLYLNSYIQSASRWMYYSIVGWVVCPILVHLLDRAFSTHLGPLLILVLAVLLVGALRILLLFNSIPRIVSWVAVNMLGTLLVLGTIAAFLNR